MANVTLSDVTKVYPGGVKAVDRVNLAIRDHEFVVLVGPSGCGKSTTLRMVAGLEEISSGIIRIGERVVNEVAPKDRDIAMVFQNYALYPHMTVYKNMAFSLSLRRRELGLSKADIDGKVRSAAAKLGIESLLERRPKELSGGQRQRVAVGRAIVRDPKVYLFDEPLSNLDAKLRVEMRSEIKRIQRGLGTTTIYVTHDQEEAMTLGDRVAVMKDGLLHQFGPPMEIYESPVNRFVAGFLGTPPMNFIEGRVVTDGERLALEDGGLRIRLPSAMRGRLTPYLNQPMTLGIRPDVLALSRPTGEVETLKVKVTLVEPLGDRKDMYMTTESGRNLVGRVDGREAVREGEQVDVHVDLGRIHLFESGDDGRAVVAHGAYASVA
ncbi:MAG: sn-glycerol-3-phosphate ABC transporter ATP-binding protein UgpC [Planctomycetes bacterium]|nr:sn-glycerol-3-phosphate ABC transporter ATP-binding protein UgpC [Planctomycetota bacterium]